MNYDPSALSLTTRANAEMDSVTRMSATRILQNRVAKSSVILMQEGAELKNVLTSTEVTSSVKHEDVHISPSFIEFTEASEGIICRQRITIKNVGRKPALVRIRESNSIAFQVKALKSGVMLNPGLSVSTSVIYSFKRPSLLRAMIPIEINGKILDYRIVCTLATERISIEPKSIDFGTIDIGYSSGIKIVTITNEGGKSTRFSIDLGKNDLEITVKPLRGIVRPHKQVKLRIELIGTNEGAFFSEFWVKSVPNIRVPLKINVIVPRFVLHHSNTTGDFTLLDFPPTAENTQRYETFVLRNVSSQIASYVVLGEIDNELKCLRDIDRRQHPVYSAFDIRPMQGRMDPFEGLVFEVGFSPTTKLMRWRDKQKLQPPGSVNERPEYDFMAFMRIVRVQCIEREDILRVDPTKDPTTDELSLGKPIPQDTAVMDISSLSSSGASSTDAGARDSVTVCLHGDVEIVRLIFEPDVLYFGDIHVGEVSQRVIRLSNTSNFLPLIFRFVRNAAARCSPESLKLKPKGSIELLVKVKGRENVESSFKLFFDAIAESYDSSVKRRRIKVKVGSYFVQCTANVLLVPRMGKTTKFSAGGHNRGVTESHQVEDSKCLQAYRGELICSRAERLPSPFTLEQTNAFSKGSTFKADHLFYWKTYLRNESHKIKGKLLTAEESDENAIIEKILRPPKWRCKELSETIRCESIEWRKPLIDAKAGVLGPLSPLQIYKIHITPTMFTFGMVAPRSRNYRQLIIENRNDIPIMIRLISLSSDCICFPEGDLVILSPCSSATRLIEFRADRVGKFNSYIDYVINNNHSFELSITADIVNKQLSLDRRDIELGKEWHREELYRPMAAVLQIKNKLGAKTSFRWEVPANFGFFVEPMSGTVRGNSILYAYVHYELDVLKANCTEVVMKCEGGTYTTVRLNVPQLKPKVSFVNDNIDLGEIPITLPTRTIAVLCNSEHTKVVFEVDSSSLVHGCRVHPLRGTIPPRGIAILELLFTFDVCLHFSTSIRVSVQKKAQLELKIAGQVTCPRLKFHPQSINARRISADAYQNYPITVTNVGNTISKLNFSLEEYPEFRVSLSPNKDDAGIGNEGMRIAAGASQNLYLHFQPVDLASYVFHLPIIINDIFGPASIADPKTLKPSEYTKSGEEYYTTLPGFVVEQPFPKIPTISIDCTVSGHVVFFNKLSYYFTTATQETQKEFVTGNRHVSREISVVIETGSFNEIDCPFSIEWSRGVKPVTSPLSFTCTLKPGEGSFFVVRFKPKQRGEFNIEAPIYVRGELDGKVFNKLCLRGEHPGSWIDCETAEMYFAPVPLRTASEKKFCLRAMHFESSTVISAKICKPDRWTGDYRNGTLVVQFPNGSVVPSSSCTEVEVNIIFKSETPVSFSLIVQFSDERNTAICPVTIFATADNNLLTTHVYLRKTTDDIPKSKMSENHVSYSSVSSESEDDDEDYDDYKHDSHCHRHRQMSIPKMSVHSYFELPSTASLAEVDSKLRSGKVESIDAKCETADNIYSAPEDVEKFGLYESDSRCSADSVTKFRKLPVKRVPSFHPAGGRSDDYEVHINRTLRAAEKWLYSGPFNFNFYPCVPDGITSALSNLHSKKGVQSKDIKENHHPFRWSFIDVLESLVGPEIYHLIGKPEPLPEDNVERVDFILRLYDKMLQFLLQRGAFLTHVTPQFLLSYNDYLLISSAMQNTLPKKQSSESKATLNARMSLRHFESRSRLCWLDVILQTFKCLVLGGISKENFGRKFTSASLMSSRRSTMFRESTASSTSSLPKRFEVYDKIMQSVVQLWYGRQELLSSHSSEESLLLTWLYYHYEQQREQDWMSDRRLSFNPHENKDAPPKRNVENFDEDLSDSLVLIAVTAAHCPFLVDQFFVNLYLCPRTYEEILHNAICVVNAWRKIRLGFVISPLEIVQPNSVQMLMLVIHLFDALPTFMPKARLKFSCPLTETITRQISFSNPTSFSVGYLPLLIGNDNGFFTVASTKSTLRLNSHDSGQVKIQFHAKKIRRVTAYLLLCGSAVGPHFGRNQTYVLEGLAESLRIATEYTIRSKLYQPIEKTLKINVPHENTVQYEIWVADEYPSRPSTLKMMRWSDLRTQKIPRRLFFNQNSIIVGEGSRECNLLMTVACIAPNHRKFWLIFQSKSGDFIIQINSEWQVSLTDRIVVEWSDHGGECICSDLRSDNIDTTCPYTVNVLIPSRNTQLWSCVRQMFEKTLDSRERSFWSRYLDTYIGLRLIRWLMGDRTDAAAQEFTHIFDGRVTYNVRLSDKSNFLTAPETFIIRDVRPPTKNDPLTVHILPSTSQLYEATLSLTSSAGKELRVYAIDFLRT